MTITDVARLAGVSPGTASKALNGRGGISADTADRVRQAAERLGYQPNALARGLLTGRSFTVGLITTDSFGRFSIPVMQGAEDALGPGRISVFLCDSRDDQIREQHYLRTLLERRVDGIIVTGRRQDPRDPIGRGLPVPVVYAMTHSTDPGDLSLIPDDEQGGALAVHHLLSTGRTSIGHVTGPRRFKAAVLRAAGAEKALATAGLELAGGEPLFGEWTEEWGRQATDVLLRSQAHLDAIFCGNDQIARGVADGLREAGRRVPDDVAVVGFDNWEVIAVASRPPLTTVDMNLRELGRAAGERLLAAIEGRPSAGVQLLPCSLVVRESSRPRHPVIPGPGVIGGVAGASVTSGASGVSGASAANASSGPSGASGASVSGGAGNSGDDVARGDVGSGEPGEAADRRATPATVPSQARVPSGQVPPAGLISGSGRERGPG